MSGCIRDTALYQALDRDLPDLLPLSVSNICLHFGASREAVINCLLVNDFFLLDYQQADYAIADFSEYGPYMKRTANMAFTRTASGRPRLRNAA